MTSSVAIRDQTSLRCTGDHRHVQLISGRPAAAQEYPEQFSEAIVHGVEMDILSGAEKFVFKDVCNKPVEKKRLDKLIGIVGVEDAVRIIREGASDEDERAAPHCVPPPMVCP